MFCPQCGTQTADGARFCPSCGASLAAVPPAPPAPPEIPPPPVFAQQTPPAPAAPAAPVYAPPATPVYEAPVHAPVPAPVWTGWPKAPLPARFVASVVDSIIMVSLVVPAYLWIAADITRGSTPVFGSVLAAVAGLWMFVYSYIKDGLKGASLGKRIAGLMVVNLKDNMPGKVGASILRALVLSFISPIEALMVLIDPKGQRLGDKAAKTQVVRMTDYETAVPGWLRPGKALAVTLLVVSLLVGLAGSVATGLMLASSVRDAAEVNATPAEPVPTTPSGETSPGSPATDVDVEAAAQVVTAFYTAINGGDMEAIKATVNDDLKAQVEPGAFEGWTESTFEFTRGWIDGETASVIGRESEKAYGSGTPGGVKFTLSKVSGGAWLITGWSPVDSTQVEGSDTTGSSTGIAGPLSDATARDVVTQILKARQKGVANIIRQLATEKFLTDSGDVWLDGVDNSEFFTKFKITAVKVSGGAATVTVTETWVDGNQVAKYGVVEQGGAVLVSTWTPQ